MGAALAALVAALAVVPGTALAAQPTQFHAHYTDSFSEEICGITVDVDLVGTTNTFLYADGTTKGTGSYRATLTNPLNGQSVVAFYAGQITGSSPVVDEQAGTITFLTSAKGLPWRIQTAQGSVLLRNAGIIAFADTFNLVTGEFVATETIFTKGPHPQGANPTADCDAILEAIA